MKKFVLTLMMGAMLLSSGVMASAKTLDTKNTVTIVSSTEQTIFHPQTQDPGGW
jgi:lipopolysaccharide export system protein LptA